MRLNIFRSDVPAISALMPLLAIKPSARATSSILYPSVPAGAAAYLNDSPSILTFVFEFDEAAANADSCILFYRWRSKAKLGAHFVALHHTEKGFVGYNTYSNSTGPDRYGESLDGFLKTRKYFGCVLITIQNKKKEG